MINECLLPQLVSHDLPQLVSHDLNGEKNICSFEIPLWPFPIGKTYHPNYNPSTNEKPTRQF